MGDDDAVWRLATDAAGIGLFSWDVDTGEVLPDDRLRALLEYGPGDVVRHIDDVLSRMPAEDRWLLERAAVPSSATGRRGWWGRRTRSPTSGPSGTAPPTCSPPCRRVT